jgi:hypothetical protein
MKRILATWIVLLSACSLPALAQAKSTFPATLATAKTIAIENDTHVDAVADGAADAIRAWGKFRLVDDPQIADVVLRFDKNKEHAGQDEQKPDPSTGQTNYSYTMSFSTSIHMKVYLKDADAPFYTTKTDESKKKAGTACVSDFRSAYRDAR